MFLICIFAHNKRLYRWESHDCGVMGHVTCWQCCKPPRVSYYRPTNMQFDKKKLPVNVVKRGRLCRKDPFFSQEKKSSGGRTRCSKWSCGSFKAKVLFLCVWFPTSHMELTVGWACIGRGCQRAPVGTEKLWRFAPSAKGYLAHLDK